MGGIEWEGHGVGGARIRRGMEYEGHGLTGAWGRGE